MGTIRTLFADGRTEEKPGDRMPPRAEMEQIVGGEIEYVNVLHNGKRTCMIVNETGAIEHQGRAPLPINEAATEIYHAASRARNDDWEGPPYIHGNAILLDGITVN